MLQAVEQPRTSATAAADIDRSRLAFEQALSSGDSEAASAIYADDATLVAPAADVVRGRTAIERFWRTGIQAGIDEVRLQVLELHQRGDLAFEIGAYFLHVSPESGDRVVDRGRYIVVLRCEADGGWRRAAEMFSPDRAPAPVAS
jgi:uncharacterized protein (TIGR02246 family)